MTFLFAVVFFLLLTFIVATAVKFLFYSKTNLKEYGYLFLLGALYVGMSAPNVFSTEHSLVHDNYWFSSVMFKYFLESLSQFGEFPFWKTDLNGGMPTMIYINNLYLLLITRFPFYFSALFLKNIDPLVLYKMNLVLTNLCFSFFMYLLLNELFKKKSVVYWGVTISLFSGISACSLASEQMAASLLYIPLILWLSIQLYRKKKILYALLLGLFTGQALCNHYPQLVFYALLCALCSYLISQIGKKPFLNKRKLRFASNSLFISIPIAVVVMSVVLFCYKEYIHQVDSPDREQNGLGGLRISYEFIEQSPANSLDPKAFLLYFPSRLRPQIETDNTYFDSIAFYIGTAGILLAALSLFQAWNRFMVFAISFTVLTSLFALGKHSFAYWLVFKIVPFAELQRIPIHMGNYINLGLILLSCMGFSRIMSWVPTNVLSIGKTKLSWQSIVTGSLFLILLLDVMAYHRMMLLTCFPHEPNKEITENGMLKRLAWFKSAKKYEPGSPMASEIGEIAPVDSLGYFTGTVTNISNGIRISLFDTFGDLVWKTNFDRFWKGMFDERKVRLRKDQNNYILLSPSEKTKHINLKYQPTPIKWLFFLTVFLILLSMALLSQTLTKNVLVPQKNKLA